MSNKKLCDEAMRKGYVFLSNNEWHGKCYCGICGDTQNYIAKPVVFWEPDDGWIVGVLCDGCLSLIRPPRSSDFAWDYRDKIRKIIIEYEITGDCDTLV
jgi:hypothetical protein